MLSRYLDDPRYEEVGNLIPLDRGDTREPGSAPGSTPQIDQVPVPPVTSDQNNYELPPNQIILFSTDATRHFTGFKGARPGIVVFCNTGSFDGVIDNSNAGSTAENQVLCHTGADVTVGPKKSALMFYDYKNSRWRTIGL